MAASALIFDKMVFCQVNIRLFVSCPNIVSCSRYHMLWERQIVETVGCAICLWLFVFYNFNITQQAKYLLHTSEHTYFRLLTSLQSCTPVQSCTRVLYPPLVSCPRTLTAWLETYTSCSDWTTLFKGMAQMFFFLNLDVDRYDQSLFLCRSTSSCPMGPETNWVLLC